jgi:hypothetical protein
MRDYSFFVSCFDDFLLDALDLQRKDLVRFAGSHGIIFKFKVSLFLDWDFGSDELCFLFLGGETFFEDAQFVRQGFELVVQFWVIDEVPIRYSKLSYYDICWLTCVLLIANFN